MITEKEKTDSILRIKETKKKANSRKLIKLIKNIENITSNKLKNEVEERVEKIAKNLGKEQTTIPDSKDSLQVKTLEHWYKEIKTENKLLYKEVNIGTAINMKLSIIIAQKP